MTDPESYKEEIKEIRDQRMSDRCLVWNLEESYLLWACILPWHSTNWQGLEISSLPLGKYFQRSSNAVILFQYKTKHSPCTQQPYGSSEKLHIVTLDGPLIRCGREVQEQLDKSLAWVQGSASPSGTDPFVPTTLYFQQNFTWARQNPQEPAQETQRQSGYKSEKQANGCNENENYKH